MAILKNASGILTAFKVSSILFVLFLTTACSQKQQNEDTPATRNQLDDVELSLQAANQATEDRLKEACADNPDC